MPNKSTKKNQEVGVASKGIPKKVTKNKTKKGYPVLMPNGMIDIMNNKKHPMGPILTVKKSKRKK
jgi:hypothetical protein